MAATGDFGTTCPIRGSVKVVKEGNDHRLDLEGFEAPIELDLAITSQGAATGPDCYDRWRMSFGEPTTWSGVGDIPSQSIGLHIGYLVNAATLRSVRDRSSTSRTPGGGIQACRTASG